MANGQENKNYAYATAAGLTTTWDAIMKSSLNVLNSTDCRLPAVDGNIKEWNVTT